MTVNVGKLLLAALCLVAVTVLIAVDAILPEAGLPIITLVAGYAIGNGNSAKNGAVSEPLIKPKADQQ